MPEHLAVLVLSKKAQDMLISLAEWLIKSKDYKPVDSMGYFDEYVSEQLEQEIVPLGDEIAQGIALAPKRYYGVAKPRDNQGAWVSGEHEQLLVCATILPDSPPPYVSDGTTTLHFPPGTKIYRAPNKYVFVSSGVVFVHAHWPLPDPE